MARKYEVQTTVLVPVVSSLWFGDLGFGRVSSFSILDLGFSPMSRSFGITRPTRLTRNLHLPLHHLLFPSVQILLTSYGATTSRIRWAERRRASTIDNQEEEPSNALAAVAQSNIVAWFVDFHLLQVRTMAAFMNVCCEQYCLATVVLYDRSVM